MFSDERKPRRQPLNDAGSSPQRAPQHRDDGVADVAMTDLAPSPMSASLADDAGRVRRGTRVRTRTVRSDYVDDDGVKEMMHEDPDGFALQTGDVDAFEAENAERENKVDDSLGGTRGGMSGSARSDKGDEALVAWLERERPQDSGDLIIKLMRNFEPIRHTLVDLDDRVIGSRVPSQQESLSYLPEQARADLAEIAALLLDGGDWGARVRRVRVLIEEFRKDVSANRVMGHPKAKEGMDRGGFEILHMSGRAVGNPMLMLPPDVLDELLGPQSMESWTGKTTERGASFEAAQHPGNLAIGSFGANTMMMAIEGSVSKEVKDFTLETFAYAPRGSRHLASHIVMAVHHKPSNQTRWYYIPGTGRYAPQEVYEHLAADVKSFVDNAKVSTGKPVTHTAYQYPTSDELLAERARAEAEAAKKSEGKGTDSKATKGSGRAPQIAPTIDVGGRPHHLNQTAGGGNCFFHALFETLNNRRSTNPDQQSQRHAVLDALRNNPALVHSHFGADGAAFNAFATTILLEGRWAENQTPGIVADALRVRIVIHRPDGSLYFDAVPNARLAGAPVATVHLYYDGYHYNSYTAAPLL